jgi:serine/threonine protein kinase
MDRILLLQSEGRAFPTPKRICLAPHILQDDGADRTFETDHTLGEGSFGFVVQARYRAQSRNIFEQCAIKIVDEPDLYEREVWMCEAIQGAFFPDFYYRFFFMAPGYRCLVFDLLGPTLADYLTANHPHGLPPSQVLRYLKQILRQLSRLHELGIVHFDLKPNNIAFKDDRCEELAIIDFGNSWFTCDLIKGRVSFPWGPPELVDVDGEFFYPETSTDVWSAGCVGFAMATGRSLPVTSEEELAALKTEDLRKMVTAALVPLDSEAASPGKSDVVKPSPGEAKEIAPEERKPSKEMAAETEVKEADAETKLLIELLVAMLEPDRNARISAEAGLQKASL